MKHLKRFESFSIINESETIDTKVQDQVLADVKKEIAKMSEKDKGQLIIALNDFAKAQGMKGIEDLADTETLATQLDKKLDAEAQKAIEEIAMETKESAKYYGYNSLNESAKDVIANVLKGVGFTGIAGGVAAIPASALYAFLAGVSSASLGFVAGPALLAIALGAAAYGLGQAIKPTSNVPSNIAKDYR